MIVGIGGRELQVQLGGLAQFLSCADGQGIGGGQGDLTDLYEFYCDLAAAVLAAAIVGGGLDGCRTDACRSDEAILVYRCHGFIGGSPCDGPIRCRAGGDGFDIERIGLAQSFPCANGDGCGGFVQLDGGDSLGNRQHQGRGNIRIILGVAGDHRLTHTLGCDLALGGNRCHGLVAGFPDKGGFGRRQRGFVNRDLCLYGLCLSGKHVEALQIQRDGSAEADLHIVSGGEAAVADRQRDGAQLGVIEAGDHIGCQLDGVLGAVIVDKGQSAAVYVQFALGDQEFQLVGQLDQTDRLQCLFLNGNIKGGGLAVVGNR